MAPSEIEALARVLVVEAPHAPDQDIDEWYGIGWVARNRAHKYDTTIHNIVYNLPPAPLWNGGPEWYNFMKKAHRHKQFDNAKIHAGIIMSGVARNPIGNRMNFYHLSGMANKKPPNWAHNALQEGSALNIGLATFV